MSFSADVKKELAAQLPDRLCCRGALAYGMLECGHAFSDEEISLQTELAEVAGLYAHLVPRICQCASPISGELQRRTRLYTRSFPQPEERKKILERFGHGHTAVSLRLNRAVLDCEDCARAYLKGAFLTCGAVTDPARDYHLEFCVPHYNFSRDLAALLREVGFPAKIVNRAGSYVIYLKESGRIEDCLTYLGACRGSLEMMNVKMVKSIRNEANRRMNCDSANIDKTVAAAATQIEALRRLEESGRLQELSPQLQELARLRMERPDLSLRELGEALEPPLSRSGVNHRLQRLLTLAEEQSETE